MLGGGKKDKRQKTTDNRQKREMKEGERRGEGGRKAFPE
jgi:hypothetical protein